METMGDFSFKDMEAVIIEAVSPAIQKHLEDYQEMFEVYKTHPSRQINKNPIRPVKFSSLA